MDHGQTTADMIGTENAADASTESRLRLLHADSAVRIGMLNNPLSGGNRSGLYKIRKTAKTIRPEILQVEVQTPEDVAAALADFARQEVNIIVVNGGDGTVQATLTAIFHKNFFETMPALAILRSAGTTSMIAGDVGLKGSRISALQGLLNWARTKSNGATVLQRSVLRVQLPSEKEPVYGMFFGAAGIYQATHFCLQKIHTRGVRGELAAGVALARFLMAVLLKDRKLISAVPITTRLNHNPPEHQKYLLLFITTLQRLFLGLRPYWGAETKPLHFTAIDARPRYLLRSLPSLIKGRQNRCVRPANGYVSHNVDEVRLIMDSGFNLDGELYAPDSRLGPVRVTHGGVASFLQL